MKIEKTFKYQQKDLTDYGFASYFHKQGKFLIIISGVFIATFLALIFITGSISQMELFMLYFFLMLIVLTPILIHLQMRRTYKTSKVFKEEQTFVIADEGVYGKSEIGESRVTWDKFHRFVVFKKTIALYIDNRQAYTLPTRIMTEDEIAEIKEFLTTNEVTKGKTKISRV